jgi:hypothetical protein
VMKMPGIQIYLRERRKLMIAMRRGWVWRQGKTVPTLLAKRVTPHDPVMKQCFIMIAMFMGLVLLLSHLAFKLMMALYADIPNVLMRETNNVKSRLNE